MRCSRAKRLINECVDGKINDKQNLNLEQHLGSCPDCKQLFEDFQAIVERAKNLENLTPSGQPWLKIRAKLETEEQKVLTVRRQKRGWLSLLFQPPRLKYASIGALFAAFIIFVGLFGLQYWSGRSNQEGEDLQKYTLAKLNEAERHYQLAIKALWEAVSAQGRAENPQVAEVFKTNLAIIDSSITAFRQLILQEPDNNEARIYLLAVYREKVDFLNKMIEAKKTSSSKGIGTTL